MRFKNDEKRKNIDNYIQMYQNKRIGIMTNTEVVSERNVIVGQSGCSRQRRSICPLVFTVRKGQRGKQSVWNASWNSGADGGEIH